MAHGTPDESEGIATKKLGLAPPNINVTPLVDVMLVLLVIFMVTAPMLQTGIDVELPETRNVANANPCVTYGGVHIKGDRIEILGTVTFEDAFGGTAGDIFSIFTNKNRSQVIIPDPKCNVP